jgi:hypothetical protein
VTRRARDLASIETQYMCQESQGEHDQEHDEQDARDRRHVRSDAAEAEEGGNQGDEEGGEGQGSAWEDFLRAASRHLPAHQGAAGLHGPPEGMAVHQAQGGHALVQSSDQLVPGSLHALTLARRPAATPWGDPPWVTDPWDYAVPTSHGAGPGRASGYQRCPACLRRQHRSIVRERSEGVNLIPSGAALRQPCPASHRATPWCPDGEVQWRSRPPPPPYERVELGGLERYCWNCCDLWMPRSSYCS